MIEAALREVAEASEPSPAADKVRVYLLALDNMRQQLDFANRALADLQIEVAHSDPKDRQKLLDALSEASQKSDEISRRASSHAVKTYYFAEGFLGNVAVQRGPVFSNLVSMASGSWLTGSSTTSWITKPGAYYYPYAGSSTIAMNNMMIGSYANLINRHAWSVLSPGINAYLGKIDLSSVYATIAAAVPQWVDTYSLYDYAPSAPKPQKRVPLPTTDVDRLSFWRGIRAELQDRFSMALDALATALGVAYPTVANLGKHRHHASTVRGVLKLHSISGEVLRAMGESAGRSWLSADGLSVLKTRGLDAFVRSAQREIYPRNRPVGGVQITDEPDLETETEKEHPGK